jgi:TolB-like protein
MISAGRAGAPQVSRPDKAGRPRLSIVVLPFANLGGDPEQEYFVDGMTESLTTDLSRISGSFALGRNASVALDHAVLHLDGATNGIDHAAELDDAPVAGALHYATVMDTEGRCDQIAPERP